MEIFNEVIIQILSILLVSFTDYVGTTDVKYKMGFVFIYFLFAYILINILSILQMTAHKIRLLYKKYHHKLVKIEAWARDKIS